MTTRVSELASVQMNGKQEILESKTITEARNPKRSSKFVRGYGVLHSMLRNLMSLFIKVISLYNSIIFLAILYSTSLANQVVEVGTRHSHQILLYDMTCVTWYDTRWYMIMKRYMNDKIQHESCGPIFFIANDLSHRLISNKLMKLY